MKKNVKIWIMTIILIVVLIHTAFAATASVTLNKDKTKAETSAVGLSKTADHYAIIYSTSEKNVYVEVERAEAGSSWKVEYRVLKAPGTSDSSDYSESINHIWRLRLYPYGWWATGGHAWGRITAP